jgi:Lipocalin-like domain
MLHAQSVTMTQFGESVFAAMEGIMRTTTLAVVISISTVAAMAFTASNVLADDREGLIGTWKLVEAVNEDLSTHEKTDIYKAGALGFITYGADGRIMAIVVSSGRKKPMGDVATGPEAQALFSTMTAYAGSYTIKGSQIIHHVDASWNEVWTGTDQVRNYKLDGDRLNLATAPSPNPFTGKMSVRTFVWERLK